MELKPQPGPQEAFLASNADITIYGGAAGGGKTYALLLEPLRHIDNPKFGAVIFRRGAGQITNEGGLWDMAKAMYLPLGARGLDTFPQRMIFPSGARVTFNHLYEEKHVYSYQGAQIPLICFDELTHFTERQFVYMLSRNRSTCGVRPYIRATTNPDADSWVARFIEWWVDQDTGYAIKERSGAVRYFLVVDGQFRWGDDRDELAKEYGMDPGLCKSATFISSSIFDNKILLKADPSYLASLNAQSPVEKERLLKGNWKIRPSAGLYFDRGKARIVPTVPGQVKSVARAWDLAATAITTENQDPDRTAGALCARLASGQYIFLDVARRAYNAAEVRALVKSTAVADRSLYPSVRTFIPQDPGQAGKEQAASYLRELAGFNVKSRAVTGTKIARAEPLSAQWQAGNVLLLQGDWNEMFLYELEGFPDAAHDDQVDAASDAFAMVANMNDSRLPDIGPTLMHESYWR